VDKDFPVLSAGPTPSVPFDRWLFTVDGAVGQSRSWTWNEFTALPSETVMVDIHCVTKWSKLGTEWTGVSVDVLLDGIDPWSCEAPSAVTSPGTWTKKGRSFW
jgi:DMSO/TMAO reductase YedYZ molybdopterin-dependent catalytic subunit